jgi:DNA-binding transcriptional regulator YiaG
MRSALRAVPKLMRRGVPGDASGTVIRLAIIPPWLSSYQVGTRHESNPGNRRLTGHELKQLRNALGEALGKSLSAADMARLCGLPPGNGGDTFRKWEVSGPTGPAAELLRILAMASERYPILDNFNVFDRFNIPEQERPARRHEFREKMRDEVRRRLG